MPGWQLARSAATIAIRWRGDLDHCDATFGERHQCAALDEPVRLLLTGDEGIPHETSANGTEIHSSTPLPGMQREWNCSTGFLQPNKWYMVLKYNSGGTMQIVFRQGLYSDC